MLLYLSLLTISVSSIILTSTGRIFTLFSAFDSAVAVDERRDPSRDVGNATNFLFSAISFSRRNSKTTRDTNSYTGRKYTKFCLLWNGTIRNDLGWPWVPKLFPVCTSPSSPICSKSTRPVYVVFSAAGSSNGVDDCCEIGWIPQRTLSREQIFIFGHSSYRTGRYF